MVLVSISWMNHPINNYIECPPVSESRSGAWLWEDFKLKWLSQNRYLRYIKWNTQALSRLKLFTLLYHYLTEILKSKSWLDESVEREDSSEASVLSSSGVCRTFLSDSTFCLVSFWLTSSSSGSLDRMPGINLLSPLFYGYMNYTYQQCLLNSNHGHRISHIWWRVFPPSK